MGMIGCYAMVSYCDEDGCVEQFHSSGAETAGAARNQLRVAGWHISQVYGMVKLDSVFGVGIVYCPKHTPSKKCKECKRTLEG